MLAQLKTFVLRKEAIKLAFFRSIWSVSIFGFDYRIKMVFVSCQLRTCEASVSQTRPSNVLVLLLSCALGPPTPLSSIFRASLRCSVKGVGHSIVPDLQFLGNFSHGIAFISQNKNRLTSFRRKFFVSGHFELVFEHTNADSPNTQLV